MPADPGKGLYIGLMSGTSADGIDVALCRFAPGAELISAQVHPWPAATRRQLLALGQARDTLDADALGRLDVALGREFARAVNALLARTGTDRAHIVAIGSHGQTVRHRPTGDTPFTMQLGDPWVLAEDTGLTVVADFRRADVAAGGQGAPLMPAFHQAVLAAPGEACAVVNLGGIANLTVLDPAGATLGFDTGPANGLLDAWCERERGTSMDVDGQFAAAGHVNPALLAALMDDAYFARKPPKSTGREYFNLAWLTHHQAMHGVTGADVQATLMALTVATVAAAVRQYAPRARRVFLCGGGVRNPRLVAGLEKALAPAATASTATAGVDPDYLEAMGFAWLARQRILRLPGNLAAVTGARGPRLLGSIHPAPERY